jgi:hypothetical protein
MGMSAGVPWFPPSVVDMLSTTIASALLVLASLAPHGGGRLPLAATDASELAPDGLRHHELLRIARDFGKPQYEIVVDGWSRQLDPKTISDVRIWWINTARDGRRSPFDRKVQRYIDIEYVTNAPGEWTVRMRGDRKEFTFGIELDEREASVYTSVVLEDGTRIERCRAASGTLLARRIVGIPVGISAMQVECVDEGGHTHTGELPYRKLRRGKLFGRG